MLTFQYLGVFFAEKAFIPLLLKNDGLKTVINMSSIGSHLSGGWGSAYTTTKLAVNRLTEHTYAEHEQEGLVSHNFQKALDCCALEVVGYSFPKVSEIDLLMMNYR